MSVARLLAVVSVQSAAAVVIATGAAFGDARAASAAIAAAPASPAAERIATLEAALVRKPDADGYAELAMACARRARETADTAWYTRADHAVEQSLKLAPGNLPASKARVWILLGRHEFAAAREQAVELNKRAPDDLQTYAFLVDANVELGDYTAAEEAAQWMLDLRPGSVPAMTRTAYLRELFGDTDGALEMMGAAYARLPEAETEERAWVLTQVGHLHLGAGRLDLADEAFRVALETFPDYHYALAQLGRLRIAQVRPAEAVAILERWYAAAPHPENLYVLATAFEHAGREADARQAYADFETAARREMNGNDNANRELTFYYVDQARDSKAALAVAERELARRQDLFTRDAYAWALAANGRLVEARAQAEAALAIGLQDADLYYRAGSIAARQGDVAAAARYYERSLAINAHSASAAAARAALAARNDPRTGLNR